MTGHEKPTLMREDRASHYQSVGVWCPKCDQAVFLIVRVMLRVVPQPDGTPRTSLIDLEGAYAEHTCRITMTGDSA